MQRSARGVGGLPGQVIPCLTGNMVWSLGRLGYVGDQRWLRGVEWIARYQRYDDGDGEGSREKPACWSKHSCHMGVVKALKALSGVPEDMRSHEVRRSIERGAEYVLAHHIHRQSHNLATVSKPGWLRLGFPLMYQTDVLEILGILTDLGYGADERTREAREAIAVKRNPRGRFKLESSMNAKMPVAVEKAGEESRWVTGRAIRVLGS